MKNILIWAGFLSSVAAAHAQPAVLAALAGPLGAGVPALVEKFADKAVPLEVIFVTADAATPPIFADLILDGDELGAPWKAAIAFEAASEQSNPALRAGTFTLPLEGVDKPLSLELLAWVQPKEGPRVVVARAALRVYPMDYFKNDIVEFFNASADGPPPPRLAVFGSADGLGKLLDAWKIPYQDLGAKIPVIIESGVIAVGISAPGTLKDDAALTPTLLPGASLLWFRPDIEAPPGLDLKISLNRVVTIANYAAPLNWENSPFFQQILLEHLQQTKKNIQLNPSHEN